MKKKVSITGIEILLLFLTLFLFSCSSNKDKYCSTCTQNPVGVKEINLTFNSHVVKFNCNYYFGKHSDENPYQFGDCLLAGESFQQLNIQLNSLLGEVISPYTVVLYFNKNLANSLDYSVANICGISTYTYTNGRIYHRLFVNSDSHFKEYTKYSAEVNEIITKQILYILQNSFSLTPTSEKSFVIVANKSYMGKVHAGKRNRLILFQQKLNLFNSNPFKSSVPTTCGPGCTSNWPNTYCVWDFYYTCKQPGICVENMQRSIIVDISTTSVDTMYKSLDTTLHYNFRDNFLSHYTTGQKYIMYYYELGAFIGDSIPLTLSLLTAYNAFQVNAAINKLLNPRENGSSVVFDRNLVSSLVALLNNYKELSDDATYLLYLDDIISDLTLLQGKTVDEILTYLENA